MTSSTTCHLEYNLFGSQIYICFFHLIFVLWAFARLDIINFLIVAFAGTLEPFVLDELVNPFGSCIGVLVHFLNDLVINGFVELIGQLVIQRIATGIDSRLYVGKDIAGILRLQLQVNVYRVIEQDLNISTTPC